MGFSFHKFGPGPIPRMGPASAVNSAIREYVLASIQVFRASLLVLWSFFIVSVCPAQQSDNGKSPEKPVSIGEQKNSPAADNPGSKAEKGAAERNENVWVSKLDNESLKAEVSRLGSDISIVTAAPVEKNFYAAEHGRPASEVLTLAPFKATSGWHGELFESHRNSVFNARTFFQVGSVMPSRLNQYGARASGAIRGIGNLMISFGQRQVGGAVNGNALVPLPSERTPLTTDPATRAIVSRFLSAYPSTPPNRPEIDQRALNTNAQQIIHDIDFASKLDRELNSRNLISLSYSLSRQFIDAFQIVAGRNPDTSIHSHTVKIAWRRAFSESTEMSFYMGFSRAVSDLRSEPNAVGPRVRFGNALEDLGPDSQYPINRAQNTFRYGAVGSTRMSGSRHTLTYGADLYRVQVNGVQTNNQRGLFQFSNNFGRTAIQNLLIGTPSNYEVSIGDMNRGFRNWQGNIYIADQWKITSRLQLYFGLRHNMETAPVEVNHINSVPYSTDWNNFSPRFSIAFRGPRETTLRASYMISYGQVLPVTYSQIRYNEPAIYVTVPNPDLVDPLKGVPIEPNSRTSPFFLSKDLVSPYSHQYGLSVEHKLSILLLRLGYQGSRTFKLLNGFTINRAVPVPGIPLTTATVNQRRPDPRYYSIKQLQNGGIAYLDAAQASLEMPYRKGFSAIAVYTFSKAIDEGSSYTSIAANKDLDHKSQTQYLNYKDKKSWSDFDSPHSLLVSFSYDLPKIAAGNGVLAWLTRGWQFSAAMMAKSGTPFYITTGSDAPGFGNVDGETGDRPNILDPSILGASVSHPDTSTQVLRRDRFAYILPGQERGNIGWNVFRKQGIQNVNAAVNRQWNWGRQHPLALRFRAEAFNLTNHAQFDEPQYTFTSPSFGKITNTLNDGRVMQFTVRLVF
jgi:hypothetical protein